MVNWKAAVLLTALSMLPDAGRSQVQREPDAEQPFVGKWQWTTKTSACTEIYDFRSDGSLYVQSGDERTDNTYTVTKSPDAKGFYALTSKVIRDYGGTDCAGSNADSTGDEYVQFVLFEPSMTMFISCNQPALEKCFGPLHRISE